MSLLTFGGLLIATSSGPATGTGPGSVAGCLFWLKRSGSFYSDAACTTPQSTNGGTVRGWADGSGAGNHATRASGTAPTLDTGTTSFSASTLRFTGGALLTLVSLATLTEGEIFIRLKVNGDPPGSATNSGLWNLGSSGTFNTHFPYSDANIYDAFGTDNRKTVGDPTPNLSSQFRVYNVYSRGGDWQAYLDNTSLFSTGSNTVSFPSTPWIGCSKDSGSYQMDGWIAEVAFFSQKLSGTDRATVYTAMNS